MNTRVYFIDFDHTLFDTDRFFRVDLKNFLLGYMLSEEFWDKSYQTARTDGYTVEKHIDEAQKLGKLNMEAEKIKQILKEEFSDLKKYLYPDVVKFLEKIKKDGAIIYLISFGNPVWQDYKLKASGIYQYFDDLFYTGDEGVKVDKILEFHDKFDEIIYIDDREQEIDLVKEKIPKVRTYLINRKNTGNKTAIKSLKEVN